MEGTGEILAGTKIDSRFSSHGGVDLRKKRGGNLHEFDATHVDGGEKSCYVPHEAATESDDGAVSIRFQNDHAVGQSFQRAKSFVRFAVAHFEEFDAQPGVG